MKREDLEWNPNTTYPEEEGVYITIPDNMPDELFFNLWTGTVWVSGYAVPISAPTMELVLTGDEFDHRVARAIEMGRSYSTTPRKWAHIPKPEPDLFA